MKFKIVFILLLFANVLFAQRQDSNLVKHSIGLKTTLADSYEVKNVVGLSYQSTFNKWKFGLAYCPGVYSLKDFRMETNVDFTLHQSKHTKLYLISGLHYSHNTNSYYYLEGGKVEYNWSMYSSYSNSIGGADSPVYYVGENDYPNSGLPKKQIRHCVSIPLGSGMSVVFLKRFEFQLNTGFIYAVNIRSVNPFVALSIHYTF
jgi:hypothetical protein